MFEDSNQNGKLDKAEILAALAAPDIKMSRELRAVFADFASEAEMLNQEIKQRTVNPRDLEHFTERLNTRLNKVIDRKQFPEGAALTPAEIPSIVALFCVKAR